MKKDTVLFYVKCGFRANYMVIVRSAMHFSETMPFLFLFHLTLEMLDFGTVSVFMHDVASDPVPSLQSHSSHTRFSSSDNLFVKPLNLQTKIKLNERLYFQIRAKIVELS